MKAQGIDSHESWVMVLACGILFFLTSLPLRLSGQLFVSILDRYDTSRRTALLPFVLSYFSKSIAGPFAVYFAKKFGVNKTFNKITLLGSIMCAYGIGCCYFAESVIDVDIFLGFMFGAGIGFVTSLIPEIINQHFSLHRAKASRFALTGNSIGGLILAPVLDLTLRIYGLYGSFLILGGILLNGIPASMLLHILMLPENKINKEDKMRLAENENENINEDHYLSLFTHENCNPSHTFASSTTYVTAKSFCQNVNTRMPSHLFHETTKSIIKIEDKSSKHLSKPISIYHLSVPIDTKLCISLWEQNYLRNTRLLTGIRKCDEISTEPLFTISNPCGININDSLKKSSSSPKSTCGQFSIPWSPLFLVITYIQSSHFYVMYLWWMIVVDAVRDKHVKEYQEVYFIVGMALFDTVGRAVFIYLTDGAYMKRSNICALCFFIIASTSLLMPWSYNFYVLFAVMCIFGFMSGCNTTGLPEVINQFFGEDKSTIAMASRDILYAPMSLTISPLVGYFRGDLGSYDGVFYVSGLLSFLSFIVLLIITATAKENSYK